MSSTSTDVKCLEHCTLKVPYEILNKRFRQAQKVLDRETTYVTQQGTEIEKLCTVAEVGEFPPPLPFPSVGEVEEENELLNLESGDASGIEDEINLATADLLVAKMSSIETDQIMADDNSESNSNNSTEKSAIIGDNEGDQKKKTQRIKGKEVTKLLGVLVERLTTLKRKAGESIADELEAARCVRKRVQHMKTYNPNADVIMNGGAQLESLSNASWKRTRLNRFLVDHLLREGMYESAKKLAEYLEITDLTNVDVFWAAKEVEESLKRHETKSIVVWCYENKSKLRKIKSTLELEIRVQEFVELVRIGKRLEAVKHARKYLAEDSLEHISAVKKCMGLLAFPTDTAIQPYSDLLSGERWNQLIMLFRQEHARLYQLSTTSVLGAVVQAGLASLKTPLCYRATTKSPNCPVCTDPLSTLATDLPFAHCAHSQLVCAISGESLNENNPPLVLPSGFVYGTRSLQETAKTNGGKVICSRTGRLFDISEAEKVYIL